MRLPRLLLPLALLLSLLIPAPAQATCWLNMTINLTGTSTGSCSSYGYFPRTATFRVNYANNRGTDTAFTTASGICVGGQKTCYPSHASAPRGEWSDAFGYMQWGEVWSHQAVMATHGCAVDGFNRVGIDRSDARTCAGSGGGQEECQTVGCIMSPDEEAGIGGT